MDIYLRAVGFSNMDNEQIKKLIEIIEKNSDEKHVLEIDKNKIYLEFYKMYKNGIGIIAKGTVDEEENIHIETFKPYVCSDWDIEIKSYLVEYEDNPIIIFEDKTKKNEIIFYLQNTIDYLKNKEYFKMQGVEFIENEEEFNNTLKKVNIAALSVYGTIILPIVKKEKIKENILHEKEIKYYKELMNRYKSGDKSAELLLKLYEEKASEYIKERLTEEDFLSVVEGYFLPIENDEISYSILGNIEYVDIIKNPLTKEEIYKLSIDTTSIKIQLFINKEDVLGLPMQGMRFMGVCKLQGKVIIKK